MGKNDRVSKKSASHQKADRPERDLDEAKAKRPQHVVYDPVSFRRTTKTCLLVGHSMEESDGDLYYHLKRTRWYYRGRVRYCTKPGCFHEIFEGDKTPWKITKEINGVEYDVTPGGEPDLVGVPIQPAMGGAGEVNSGKPVAPVDQGVVNTTGPGFDTNGANTVPADYSGPADQGVGEHDAGDGSKEQSS